MANSAAAVGILTEVFASATLEEWRRQLADFSGQWAVVQDTLEAAADPQTVANGYIQECETAAGHAVPSGGGARPVRRGAGGARPGPPSSTSTATHPGRHRASTKMPSSTSRSAASSPDRGQPLDRRSRHDAL